MPTWPVTPSFLIQAWAQADAEPGAREMLVGRREQLVMAGTMLLEEGIARGELPRRIDTTAIARAYTALLDAMLLAKAERGPVWRRAEAERQAREILALLITAAARPDRPAVGEVAPRPYAPLEPDGARERGARERGAAS